MISRPKAVLLIIAFVLCLLFAPLLFTTSRIAGNFGDVYLHYYPLKYLVAEHLVGGRLPLWNPYIFAGQPLQANPQSAVFYPVSMIFALFGLPLAFNWFCIIHLGLGILFFYLFLTSRGIRNTGSLVGSLSFGLSAFLVYKIPSGHPVALSGYIWLPLVMLGADRLRESRRDVWILFLAGVLALQFMSGHTFPVYISLVYLAANFAYHRFEGTKELAWCGAAAFTLAAIQFLPSFELSRVSETANWAALTASYSLPLRNMVNVMMPNFFGNVIDGTYLFPSNPSFFFERHAVYFGVIPALLAVSGAYYAVRDKKYFFPILILLGIVLALGFNTPVYRFLYRVVPGIGFLRVPARFYFLVVAAGGVCAALAWQRIFGTRSALLKLVLCAVIAGELLAWGSRFIYSEDMTQYRRPSALTGVINPLYRVITQPDLIPSNKSMLYHHFNLNGYEAIFLEDFVRYLALQEKQFFGTTGLARTDLDSPLARGLAAGYVVTTATAAAIPLEAVTTDGLYVYAIPRALPRVYLPGSVRVIPDRDVYEQLSYLRNTEQSPADEVVVGRDPAERFAGEAAGRILSYSIASDRISAEIRMKNPGPVVFSEPAYPGWKAYAAGRQMPILRGDKLLRTVFLPAGEFAGVNRFIMIFQPLSFTIGVWLSLAGLVIAAAILIQYTLRLDR